MSVLKQMMYLMQELDKVQGDNQILMDIKRNEFLLACRRGDDKEIEAARQGCVDQFSASLDEMVRLNKQINAISKDVSKL
jgi:hypothetical protein